MTTVVSHNNSREGKPYGVGNVVLRLKQKETPDMSRARDKLKLGKTQNNFAIADELDQQLKEAS